MRVNSDRATPPSLAQPFDDYASQIEQERIGLLFGRDLPPMVLAAIFAILLAWILNQMEAKALPAWLFLRFLILASRFACHVGFYARRNPQRGQQMHRLQLWLLAADGIVWAMPVFLIRSDDLIALSTVMAALVGVTSVGCIVLSASFAANAVFCVSAVVPFILHEILLGAGKPYSIYLASALTVFLVVVLTDGKRAAAATTELLRLRFQSADLLNQAKQALATAAASSEAKTRFMAAISHEIRTPMHVVLGMLELLVKRETDPAKQSQLMATQKSGAHLLGLFNDVLDLSRIEAGALELKPATFDIRMAVDAVVTPYRAIAEGKGLTLPVDTPRTGDFSVFADEVRVRQILYNLIGNAISHTAHGHVAIVLVITPVALEISVTDSGSGIPDGYQATIFEPFRQGPVVSRSEHAGSGLGLAISRQLAESMGGTLVLERSNQEGSSFKLTLPRHARA